jgi:hypothetical protein
MADTSTIPPNDPVRKLTVADPDGPGDRHVAVVGDTYSILVSGTDTAGRYHRQRASHEQLAGRGNDTLPLRVSRSSTSRSTGARSQRQGWAPMAAGTSAHGCMTLNVSTPINPSNREARRTWKGSKRVDWPFCLG